MTTATVNKFTPEILEKMKASAPLNKEKCAALAAEFGADFSSRSIIAKAKREGIEYQNAAPAVKKPKGESKADILESIEKKLNAELPGLLKAPLADLRKLADLLPSV
jgi:hypothetical protein